MVAASNQASNPTAYTEEVWFNTTTHVGGKLIGFGDQQTGLSSNYDRHIYMQNDGTLAFGAWTGQTNLAISPNSRTTTGTGTRWSPARRSDGMKLYVDGALVATNPQTQAQGYSGYWRIGGDNTWNSSSPWFNGKLDEASVYSSVLPASRILAHYQAGAGIVANQPPVASFTSSHTDLTATFDASASSDPEGTIADVQLGLRRRLDPRAPESTHPTPTQPGHLQRDPDCEGHQQCDQLGDAPGDGDARRTSRRLPRSAQRRRTSRLRSTARHPRILKVRWRRTRGTSVTARRVRVRLPRTRTQRRTPTPSA